LDRVANDLLKKIKANQPEVLTVDNDFLGTIPKGDMIKGFLDSLLDREDTDIQMLALYGEWGSGKTSLMNYVKEQLDEEDAFKTVFFPSWEMEKDDNLSLSLLESIIESEDGVDKISIKEAFLSIGMGICKGLSAKIGPININFKEVMQSVEEYNKSITDDSALKRIKKFKEEYSKLEKLILEKTKCEKLVVFIDDLDRCEPENVLNLLSAIKLFFIFGNRTIFVCGLDEKAVDEAVKVRYKEVVKSGEYMEKIFDISFDMPKPDINKMIAYYFDDIPDAVTGVQQFFEAMHFTNPRRVKKVLNKYLLIRYYQENGLDRDGLIPDQNIAFFRYLTLFIIILYKFESDNFETIKNYDAKLDQYVSTAINSDKRDLEIFMENMLFNQSIHNITIKGILRGAIYSGKDINGTTKSMSLQQVYGTLAQDSINQHAQSIFVTLFSPMTDDFTPLSQNNFKIYRKQFYKEKNLLSMFCAFIEKNYHHIKAIADSVGVSENSDYRLWNIFDMAERYL